MVRVFYYYNFHTISDIFLFAVARAPHAQTRSGLVLSRIVPWHLRGSRSVFFDGQLSSGLPRLTITLLVIMEYI